jgi:hypothetical protein
MIDGQVDNDRVWFSFDLQELEWLHDLIPRGDEFRKDVAKAIRKLEHQAASRAATGAVEEGGK